MFTIYRLQSSVKHLGLILCAALFATSAAFAANTIDLSTVEPDAENVIHVKNNDILTGELDGANRPYKVLIDESAGTEPTTVTLDGVTINGTNDEAYPWAGITCEGDCNIVLAEGSENKVKGFYSIYPGIHVPEGKTLTISGEGELDASSNGFGAGIGGGYNISSGNIVIDGGVINAMGGSAAAGIGTGSNDGTLTMGAITINGGTVIAMGGSTAAGIGTGSNDGTLTAGAITINGGTVNATGGDYAAGIGTGENWGPLTVGAITINGGTVNATGGECAAGIGAGYNWGTLTMGAITITNGVTKVVATKGSDALHSVGIGYNRKGAQATITSITIGGETIDQEKNPIADKFYVFPVITYDITFDANGGSGTMQKQELVPGKKLNANAFTHKELLFAGWNTKKDGSGLAFKDEAIAPDFSEEGSSVTLYAQWFDGDISKLKNDYIAQDGNTLTGTLGGNYKISIADGATVTLDGVTINGTNDEAYPWAGITCEGDCNIVLAEGSENKVKGFYSIYPGIHVPEGKTLTISGEGELDASSNGFGAGIGGGYNISSGNIVIDGGVINATGGVCAAGIGTGYYDGTLTMGTITINGGTINATGGNHAAGIGAGFNWDELTIGAITINGGTINATGGTAAAGIGTGYNDGTLTMGTITINGGTVIATGSNYAAGIGTGSNYGTLTMGAITITNGVTKVIATKGSDALHSVGIGYNENGAQATITSITIGGETIDQEKNPIADKFYVFPVITYDITFDANGGSGTMQKQELVPGKKLNANAFTHKELLFAGWNTKKDGSGLAFKDEAIAPDFSEEGSSVTLYAQWFDGDISKLKNDYIAQDGNTLTGTLGGNYKISIADGATVTLDGVTINGTDYDAYPWAGITCEGDCNIVLAKDSENKVKGFYGNYPGIHVPPEGKTLTISGEGKLDASSNGDGAGIGGGYNISSGNIVIDGGVINATGGVCAAGIGTGYYDGTLTMGTITINGGTINATGGNYAAGIGTGYNSGTLTAGAIIINGGTINATGGNHAAGIGAGFNWDELTIGAITINGGTINATGGKYASGIGTGYNDGTLTMGAITITNGVTKVIATKGSDALHSVGIGYNKNGAQATITSITIGGQTVDQENNPIANKTYVFIPEILVIEETSGQKHALINGIYSGESALNIDKDTDVDTVTIKRTFAKITNKDNNGNPLPNYFTIVFPFDVEGKNLEGIEIIAKFRGVVKNKTTGIKEVKAERTWCDEVANENCHYETATLTAYTPYLVQLKDGATSIGVKGAVTLKKTPEDPSALDVAATESDGSGEYVFRAMLQGKTWQKTDPEITGENKAAAYGYSANDVKDVASAGEFVKVGAGSYIMPLRAYIYKKPEPSSIRSNASYAIRHDELSNDDIPDRMNVVIVDSDDSGNERTTVIGQFKARTGEFRWTTSTFDLKGRNVGNGKKARGAYYGKRILKK